jgi:predicted AAA+ superfamily ATPase
MTDRKIKKQIIAMAKKMPVIAITGPRQSGKTTLAKMCFPDYKYVNLESPDILAEAKYDPRSFLLNKKNGIIIDEVQRFPELFSYIQTLSDESGKAGEYILTGSQNFLLFEKISQSLAGRVFITNLLPFSFEELATEIKDKNDYTKYIFNGFYPRLYNSAIKPSLFYPSYIQTYAERDLRQIANISDLFLFQKFLRIAAGRIGQLINFSNIANELDIDLKTVKSWFNILETSFIVFFLQPHHKNFNKRIVKTPKLYFYDTGLACNLLGIKKQDEVETHWAKGALFENMIITDIIKNFYNRATQAPVYFWRDNIGNEVDCIIDEQATLKCIEIKSSRTFSPDFFKGLNYYHNLNESSEKYLIYGGDKNRKIKDINVVAWNNTSKTL